MNPPPPIPLEQAQQMLLEGVRPAEREWLAVAECAGRYLAAPLLARRTQPAADLSAMDGYAICVDDLAGPWRIVGESAAGHPFQGTLEHGQAVRISTGALMPGGGGAVLLQENAARDGEKLALNGEGDPTPRHIRRKGFDFIENDLLLPAGNPLGPAQMALALSGGHSSLTVARRASVAILDSGDELASDPEQVARHQIPASNGAMLAAMAAPFASHVKRLGPVPDRLADMVAAFERASECDVIVTSGGASIGDHDLVRPALEQWGAEIDFWRIGIKPGKPLMVARRGEQIILGLPGNPVSSYVTAFLFLLPLLRALAGASAPHILPMAIQASLDGKLPATGDRQEFVRAQYTHNSVSPLGEQDSSGLQALANCNALIQRKPHSPPIEEPKAVWLYPLQYG